ncbi:malate synthase [Ferrithrix thermotolerans DSM 19514]|uniref:Malate synthase n=1 Tax=Ferrithrix thermotolerans DSM 19514 TaxID=1121881 RepID=A0A1M4S7L7_9ACTN|nr:malate synthase A [Ferrithrix thermotolerans]SHE28192.1 malate synthase [Ferrithrix thermotolerans DSM 19514]
MAIELIRSGVDDEALGRLFTDEALVFLEALHGAFSSKRQSLLAKRLLRNEALRSGERFHFDEHSRARTDSEWKTAEIPEDLLLRRVEITGPTDAKMVINALNSGADVFMADFEDSNAPSLSNMVSGQITLQQAIRRTLTFENGSGKSYALGDELATLIIRPRGWHLLERHLLVDGDPIAGALFDFGLYLVHNYKQLESIGSGPYFYLPKLESGEEAKLWAEIFEFSERWFDLKHSTIKVTVLLETFPAVFEIDEILYELRNWIVGMNAGRWDYLFSFIKTYGKLGSRYLLPDRNSVTMDVPFMRAYCDLLVQSCHRRGAYAIGGMAAFIPSRKDPAVNESALERVRSDKSRELQQGFDGSWVAHPDLVPVCMEVFSSGLKGRPNQLQVLRDDVVVRESELSDINFNGATMTMEGLTNDVSVSLRYITSWLKGQGAVAIYNLMEDAATAEIARSQIWQWVNNSVELAEGVRVESSVVENLIDQEVQMLGSDETVRTAAQILREVALSSELPDFLTTVAYRYTKN